MLEFPADFKLLEHRYELLFRDEWVVGDFEAFFDSRHLLGFGLDLALMNLSLGTSAELLQSENFKSLSIRV